MKENLTRYHFVWNSYDVSNYPWTQSLQYMWIKPQTNLNPVTESPGDLCALQRRALPFLFRLVVAIWFGVQQPDKDIDLSLKDRKIERVR